MNSKVDFYFNKNSKWQEAYNALREIVLGCKLTEELKWGCPCYTLEDDNIVLIHGFKNYCALLFMQGALLKDPKGILIQQTKNVQSARQLRFKNAEEITKNKTTIQQYVKEAIALNKAGLKVELKKTKEYEMPEELDKAMQQDGDFKKAFYALTPGRQRGYLLHFSGAKQSATRVARIEKAYDDIFEGKGLNDM